MALKLDAKIPAGALEEKWSNHKAAIKVVSPANKRKLDIIIVGTGLGGASAAASLGELGYNVKVFCIQDSPRRLKCIANIVATIIFLGFAAVVVVYFIKSICPCCAGAC